MNFPKVLTWKKRRRPLKLHCRLVPWQHWGSVCLEDHPSGCKWLGSPHSWAMNMPFGRGTLPDPEGTYVHHGYQSLANWDDPPSAPHNAQGSLYKWNPFLSGIKQSKPMVNLRDLLKNSALFGSVSWNDPSAMPNVNTWGKLQHSSFLGFWWFNDLKIIRQAKNISGGGGISFEKTSGSHRVL